MIDFETYKTQAQQTANKGLTQRDRLWAAALGLVCECIELEDAVADCLDGAVTVEIGRHNIVNEAGDAAWYAVELDGLLGLGLDGPPAGAASQKDLMGLCFDLRRMAALRVGEVVKKNLAHGHPTDLKLLRHPLNNILALLAQVGACLGAEFGVILEQNNAKLAARHPAGFNSLANRE